MSTATYRFTVEDYERMFESGILSDDARVELLYGEIVPMNPPNSPHDYTIDLLNYWSIDVTNRNEIWVRVQNSLGIPKLDSVPEPDVAWMKARDYRSVRPEPEDVLLVSEVSESSLGKDRFTKGRLYAEAGIQDYWIVNLVDLCIEVYRRPQDGHFQSHEVLKPGDELTPLARPAARLDVAAVLGR